MTLAAGIQNNQMAIENNNDVQRIVDTCCLGCVFAEGKFTTPSGDKLKFCQENCGCAMDVLRKLRKQGVEIQDCVDKAENEFHVIQGRVCPFHRTPNWKGWGQAEQNIEKAMVMARQEVTIRPDVVIYFDKSMRGNDITTTINALNRCDIKPQRIYLVNNGDLLPSQIMKLMSKCPLPWRTETLSNRPQTQNRALDVITSKCDGIFVTYFSAGYVPPKDFFVPIDVALHDDLDKFILLEPLNDSLNGLTVLRQFYKQAGGHINSPIVDKAKRISKEQQCQYLVRPVTDIVTQLVPQEPTLSSQ